MGPRRTSILRGPLIGTLTRSAKMLELATRTCLISSFGTRPMCLDVHDYGESWRVSGQCGRPPVALSPLLCHALGRRLRRQGDPGVAGLLPHRDGWRREIRVGEVADGNSDVSGKAFVLPVDVGAACRAEIKGKRVAAFGCPHPRRSFTGDGDLLTGEARLVANHGASAALALQAVAHGDARWFALNRKVKLPAGTGGASCHRSAPWLLICVSN